MQENTVTLYIVLCVVLRQCLCKQSVEQDYFLNCVFPSVFQGSANGPPGLCLGDVFESYTEDSMVDVR
jgi:hypothetical protein